MNALQYRAVQLDLARQKEPLEAIGEFISFAAEWGYNTLFLYLEGAVRTKAFSGRHQENSYDENEIRQILEMASVAGLEVIPGLATLGHAEHFLDDPSLGDLRETGSWSPNMFCPSNPKTYEFLEAYLSEMAALFPSRYVHIGCDETWALGSCPVCRERRHKGETREDLFIQHVSRLHCLLGSLGKRLWMWSDMLETFSPAALGRIPKDVVLCEWHYGQEQMSHDGFQGHFNNLRRRDALALHEKSGHDTILCCGGEFSGQREWGNGLAITEIGRTKEPFGWLLTHWKMTATFLPGILPTVALMGRLWAHPQESESAAQGVVFNALFPNARESERLILRYTFCGHLWKARLQDITQRGKLSMEETRYWYAVQASATILQTYLARLSPGRERDMVEELVLRVRLQASVGLARQAAASLIDSRSSSVANKEAERQLQDAIREMDDLAQIGGEYWKRWRPGIHPDTASLFIRELAMSLRQFFANLAHVPKEKRGILNLRLFLVECHSSPRLSVDIYDGSQWITATSGSYKPLNLRDASYSLEIPLLWESSDPQKLRIKLSGYGGQGVQFASVLIGQRQWIPQRILSSRGLIQEAEALLRDDAFICYLGEKDTLKTVEEFSDQEEAVLEIKLTPTSEPYL